MFKNIYDTPETREVFFKVEDANLYRLDEGILFTAWEIWTEPDKAGTQLTDGVDYLVGAQSDRATQITGDDVYQGFQVLTSTYHDVALFATITWVGNIGDTDVVRPQTDYYGDRIGFDDVLLYNNTPALTTSEGAVPLSDTVHLVDSVIWIDGVPYPNQALKWPGKRWGAFCGAERENVLASDFSDFSTLSNATITVANEWATVLNTASGGYVASTISGFTDGVVGIIMKQGNSVSSALVVSSGSATVTWGSSGSIAIVGTDLGAFFLDDEQTIAYVFMQGGATLATFRLYGGVDSGDYTYYYKPQAVDADHWLPYFEGVLPASDLTPPVALGQAGSLSLWFYNGGNLNDGEYHTFLDSRDVDATDNNFILRINNTGELRFSIENISGTGFAFLSTASFASDIPDGWNHLKLTYSTSESTDNNAYLNGGSDLLTTKATPTGTFSFPLGLSIGGVLGTFYLNSLIQDVHFRPSVDTSTTHYDSGLPWIDGDATISEDGSSFSDGKARAERVYYDQHGQQGIVFDAEIDGVWVTKWANGRMEQRFTSDTATTSTTASGNIYRSANTVSMAFPVPFVGVNPTVALLVVATSGLAWPSSQYSLGLSSVNAYLLGSGATSAGYLGYKAEGRWK